MVLWWYVNILGMCFSIAEADAIRILMHTQRYTEETYEAASDVMRNNSHLLQCSAILIRFDTMQWKKYDRFYFFGSDRQQIIN